MRVALTVFCLPKAGNRADEIEDAVVPVASGRWSGPALRVAVADGASEALLSGPWAAVLARSVAHGTFAVDDGAALLRRAQARWTRWTRWYLWRRLRMGRPVQWFEEPGLAAGAFAALVGLGLEGDGAGGHWAALALGDSCLFQVRAGQLLAAFPLAHADDFGVRPLLIGSRAAGNDQGLAAMRTLSGAWQAGDRFYLMTDALAQWWLGECAAGRAPWRPLDRLCGPGRVQAFPRWVETRRRRHELRNDDVTLLRVAIQAEQRQ
ncbi:MAG: hypothetical protein IT340_19465, partial [Chloroflexi bacterium]|nr:hypothetical protein [Chloroflexota bacterium]